MDATLYFHGTRSRRSSGERIEPSLADAPDNRSPVVRLTADMDEALWDAELAAGDEPARVYVVEPSGPVSNVAALFDVAPVGRPTMSLCSRDSLRVVREVTASPFYHGTKAALVAGDLIEPGRTSNYGSTGRTTTFVYLSRTLDAATWGAELALGDGRCRIYIVEPTGGIEDDPNVTNKRFRGNPTQSFRSRSPLRVIGEVTAWKGHAPEALQAMKAHLARLASAGVEPID